ncbi:MAG: hypothetical protein AB7G75_29435 [Candidatus Binatia bacterium]
MINPLRPETLRLLEQDTKDEKATTIIRNRPIAKNLYPIRASLGLSPIDSLLYAPITLIVEGPTESLCLHPLLIRLKEGGIKGFHEIDQLLELCHFISGEGDSFAYWCQLAESQRSKAIVFLDGDKRRKSQTKKIEEHHPDVPIVFLDEEKEFEDLVPRDEYFKALAEISGEPMSYDAFSDWIQLVSLPAKMMFSKRVERWLETEFPDVDYDKVAVMRKAIELTNPKDIQVEPLQRLVVEITKLREQLVSLTS